MIFTGKARLAEGVTSEKLYGILTVGLEINMDSEIIVDADCTLSTDVAKRFFKQIIVGYNVSKGLDPLMDAIKQRYHGDVAKALGAALRNGYREYENFVKKKSNKF